MKTSNTKELTTIKIAYKLWVIQLLLFSVSCLYGQKKNYPLLPSGPKEEVDFGAYSTQLKYTDEWDKLWPVSEVADVVVRFGAREPRFIFWRGTSYIPCWGTYDGPWFTNEFFERRGGASSGTVSMVEPMSDKQCRYSNIRIIENNDARVVIHWRYAPTDLEYSMAYLDQESNWGDWADEYYVIYPDAIGIRTATLFTSAVDEWIEYHESIVINQPGTVPDDNINNDALTFLNLNGDPKTYSWTEKGGPELKDLPEQVSIQRVNLKSDYKPFTVVLPENATARSYGGHAPGYNFNFWSHWPVSQTKSHTSVAKNSEHPSHTSLSHLRWKPFHETDKSKTWVMMHGMTKSGNEELVQVAASWINPPGLKLSTDGITNEGYNAGERAYVISLIESSRDRLIDFEIPASEDSPIYNPAFLIKNWGTAGINLKINGEIVQQKKDYYVGVINSSSGTDLIVWVKMKSAERVLFSISADYSR
jgi:hypothetical protein